LGEGWGEGKIFLCTTDFKVTNILKDSDYLLKFQAISVQNQDILSDLTGNQD